MTEPIMLNYENKEKLEDILLNIKNDFDKYPYDQFKLYPAKGTKNWHELLINRIKSYLQNPENTILFFNSGKYCCLIGVRFSDWDIKHFGFEIGHITVFFHSQGSDNANLDAILDHLIKFIREKSIKFASIRINGDDLDIIHAFERARFSYYENVIWPVKVVSEFPAKSYEDIRLMKENELSQVKEIASNFQYQRGHFHCDSGFDIEKVNTLYAKWVESALERKENILVADYNGKVAGYFISGIDKNLSDSLGVKYGRLKSLALDSSYRGKGFGKKLFEGTCKLLEDQGADIIDSGYSTKNHISAKLHNVNHFNSVYEEITLHKWI